MVLPIYYLLRLMVHPVFKLSVGHRLACPLVDTSKSSCVIAGSAADQSFALFLQMQHVRSTGTLSPSPPAWDLRLLQQQACAMVPREQFLQLQHQLLQAERINQRLQEELENRTSETNTPQVRGSFFFSL